MIKIGEIKINDRYSVAYRDGSLFKVVNLYDDLPDGVPEIYRKLDRLEIQQLGIDFTIWVLELKNGEVFSLRSIRSNELVTHLSERSLEKKIEEFGKEFSEIFKINPKLRPYVETRFRPLVSYLAQQVRA